jgi:serine phosphatase RsbU (regulator of sigma subunit)
MAQVNKSHRRAIQSRFCTVIYGTLSDGGSLTYSNAGHNPCPAEPEGLRRLETGG